MKFLKPPFSFKRSFARTLSRSWNRWQMFQFRHSRWILFWTFKEIREHYRLWRMRAQIMKQPRSLMVEISPGHFSKIYDYTSGMNGTEMVKIKDLIDRECNEGKPRANPDVDPEYWKHQEIGMNLSPNLESALSKQGVTARKRMYEILHNQDSGR